MLTTNSQKQTMPPRRCVLVTGASRGLGLAITKALLIDGVSVIGLSRDSSPELDDMIDKHQNQLRFVSVDLSRPDELTSKRFQDEICQLRPLHGLVNNAALAYDDLITNLKLEPLEALFRVNVSSPMLLTKLAVRNMLLHQVSGSIVQVSSISAHTGYKGLAMYAATKGALESFSKNTAREWGAKKIRSNCVIPGFMETEMSASLDKEQKNRIYKRTALKEPTSLKSVAKTVTFLLSDQACSITGQNLIVDSGTI